jgi:hypothetical protein
VPEPYRSPDWALVPAKPAQGLNNNNNNNNNNKVKKLYVLVLLWQETTETMAVSTIDGPAQMSKLFS